MSCCVCSKNDWVCRARQLVATIVARAGVDRVWKVVMMVTMMVRRKLMQRLLTMAWASLIDLPLDRSLSAA